jgi:ribonuclease HI
MILWNILKNTKNLYTQNMSPNKLPIVDIFSDWWANPNPGPGWYGVIMKCWDHQKDFSQGYKRTTNNRMELMGAITGFKKLKTRSKVTLNTDSQYTINWLQKWWAKKWKANNWFRTGSQKAQNWDLWKILLEESEKHEVSFNWIKGHNGHIENELCDELATLAMQRSDLLVDEWFIEAPAAVKTTKVSISQTTLVSEFEAAGVDCKKCQNPLVIKYPKHTKKTLEKQYYYEYFHHCESCKTNYMLQEAKRDIKTLKI